MLTPDKEASGRDTPIPAPYLTTAWVDWQQAAGSILQGILIILWSYFRAGDPQVECGAHRDRLASTLTLKWERLVFSALWQ